MRCKVLMHANAHCKPMSEPTRTYCMSKITVLTYIYTLTYVHGDTVNTVAPY